MTGMLASVNSIAEALLVLDADVDIVDLKEPARGALGALDTALVKQIVAEIDGRCPVSATVGDLPMQPELVCNAVTAMAATGVDFIKIGFFPGGDWTKTVAMLSGLANQKFALIAVLFADTQPDFSLLPSLKMAAFKGVMLDTMDKTKGSLPQVMAKTEIVQFVSEAKSQHLLCGLAGSLRQQDIAGLLPSRPDYLGFRGALCERHNRVGKLSKQAVANIKQAITNGWA